jgi:hypothetical protein
MKANILHGSGDPQENENAISPRRHGDTEERKTISYHADAGTKEIGRIAGTYRGLARMIADQKTQTLISGSQSA